MTRVSHDTWASVIGVAYLGLMVNLLLVIGGLPLVVLLVTTDPVRSWPLLALAAPLCAPAVAAAFATYRAHATGERAVVRVFARAWLGLWRKAAAIGVVMIALVVVLLADIRMLAGTAASVVVVPVLLVLTLVTVAASTVALAALADAPGARLRDIARVSLLLSVRCWHLSLVSLAVVATQAALFTGFPALALGLTATPALYVVWANSRHALRPVLRIDESAA